MFQQPEKADSLPYDWGLQKCFVAALEEPGVFGTWSFERGQPEGAIWMNSARVLYDAYINQLDRQRVQ